MENQDLRLLVTNEYDFHNSIDNKVKLMKTYSFYLSRYRVVWDFSNRLNNSYKTIFFINFMFFDEL